MTGLERTQISAARRAFHRGRPGVVERLERLPGQHLPASLHIPDGGESWKTYDPTDPTKTRWLSLHASLSYQLDQSAWTATEVTWPGAILINMTMTAHNNFGLWDIVQCAYHCGPVSDPKEVYFRICDNKHRGFHFHLRGRGGETGKLHIPAEKANQALTREPKDFLQLVERFLQNGMVPIEETT